jgi:hypothetical protein
MPTRYLAWNLMACVLTFSARVVVLDFSFPVLTLPELL